MVTYQLRVHSLVDGTLVRSFDRLWAATRNGGLCITPGEDTVFLAAALDHAVHEIRVSDGALIRSLGRGMLTEPECVTCDENILAVSGYGPSVCWRTAHVTVLCMRDGHVLAQFGAPGNGLGALVAPRGLRLLPGGRELVAADHDAHRLCVFTTQGAFVRTIGAIHCPHDVAFTPDGRFLVAAYALQLVRRKDTEWTPWSATALAMLPNDEFVSRSGTAVSLHRNLFVRATWIVACFRAVRRRAAME